MKLWPSLTIMARGLDRIHSSGIRILQPSTGEFPLPSPTCSPQLSRSPDTLATMLLLDSLANVRTAHSAAGLEMIESVLFTRMNGTSDRRLALPPSKFCSGCLLPSASPHRGAATSVPSKNLGERTKNKPSGRSLTPQVKGRKRVRCGTCTSQPLSNSSHVPLYLHACTYNWFHASEV
jgi:hypothetical protein